MSTPQKQAYKLSYMVLPSHLAATKEAIFAAGAGAWDDGRYAQVCFEIPGFCEFMPSSKGGAVPHTGEVDKVARTEEVFVQAFCLGEEVARKAVAALKKAHPYEIVAYDVVKVENF